MLRNSADVKQDTHVRPESACKENARKVTTASKRLLGEVVTAPCRESLTCMVRQLGQQLLLLRRHDWCTGDLFNQVSHLHCLAQAHVISQHATMQQLR